MDARDVYNLYEAYRSVYEDREYLSEDFDYDLQEAKRSFPSDKVKNQTIKHERDYLQDPSSRGASLRRATKMKAISSTVGAGDDPRKTIHGQDLRKLGKSEYNEELDLYDVVLDHLLDEGYCDDVESAEVIMANMSEEWVDEIVEGVADKKLPPEKRAQSRNERTFTYIKGHDATRARRKEHRDRRGVRGNIGGEGGANWRYDDEKSEKDYPSFRVRGRGYA